MRTIQLTEVAAAASTAAETLSAGGVVLMPMDTSYGLAADATNEAAVASIFAIKNRPPTQPLSVIVSGRTAVGPLADFSVAAQRLWQAFLPGELTIVVPLRAQLAAAAGSDTIGLREPDHPLTKATALAFGRPYTATSANRYGSKPARSVSDFMAQFADPPALGLVIDGGTLPERPSSTVVSTVNGVSVLREGTISSSDINQAIG